MSAHITVNGQRRDYHGEALSEVIAAWGLDAARPGLAVAVNARIAPRAAWPTTRLAAGDSVEIIQAKAGG